MKVVGGKNRFRVISRLHAHIPSFFFSRRGAGTTERVINRYMNGFNDRGSKSCSRNLTRKPRECPSAFASALMPVRVAVGE